MTTTENVLAGALFPQGKTSNENWNAKNRAIELLKFIGLKEEKFNLSAKCLERR